MKKILITGKNSYVGTSFEKWLAKYPEKYSVDLISVRDDSWMEKDFSGYDVVLHVAGIAHIKETKENAHLYYKVNRDLAYEVAKKAKSEGVIQFIFLSSMSVYGVESGVINKNTPLKPKNNYGKSKLEAEELISSLENDEYRVAIIRPPMIYGKGCKGNYSKLAKLALKLPVFPNIGNYRSMVFIDNLCVYVRCIIDIHSYGLHFPQNIEYVNTSEMVQLIAKIHGKNIRLTILFNPILKIMKKQGSFNKMFGNLIYEETLSNKSYIQFNSFIGFEESIRLTEG